MGTRAEAETKQTAPEVQRRGYSNCNGNIDLFGAQLEVIFEPGTWRYKEHHHREWEDQRKKRCGEMRMGVVRHGTENFDLVKLHLGCLLGHSSGY